MQRAVSDALEANTVLQQRLTHMLDVVRKARIHHLSELRRCFRWIPTESSPVVTGCGRATFVDGMPSLACLQSAPILFADAGGAPKSDPGSAAMSGAHCARLGSHCHTAQHARVIQSLARNRISIPKPNCDVARREAMFGPSLTHAPARAWTKRDEALLKEAVLKAQKATLLEWAVREASSQGNKRFVSHRGPDSTDGRSKKVVGLYHRDKEHTQKQQQQHLEQEDQHAEDDRKEGTSSSTQRQRNAWLEKRLIEIRKMNANDEELWQCIECIDWDALASKYLGHRALASTVRAALLGTSNGTDSLGGGREARARLGSRADMTNVSHASASQQHHAGGEQVTTSTREEAGWGIAWTAEGIECRQHYLNFSDPRIEMAPWTASEDAKLESLAHSLLGHNWTEIAQRLGTHRTALQCFVRYQRHLNKALTSSVWTPPEDERLTALVQELGAGNWADVAANIPMHTRHQCLHRWRKKLDPCVVGGRWAEEEDVRLRGAVRAYDQGQWALVSQHVPRRTDVKCRERWSNVLDPTLAKNSGFAWTSARCKKLVSLVQAFRGGVAVTDGDGRDGGGGRTPSSHGDAYPAVGADGADRRKSKVQTNGRRRRPPHVPWAEVAAAFRGVVSESECSRQWQQLQLRDRKKERRDSSGNDKVSRKRSGQQESTIMTNRKRGKSGGNAVRQASKRMRT